MRQDSIFNQSRQSLMFHVAQKIISNKQTQIEKDYIVKVNECSINKLPQNKKVNIKPKEKLIMKSEYDLLERCFTEQQRRNSVSETSVNESSEATIPIYCQKWLLSKFKRNEFPQLQKQYEIMRNIKADTDTIKQIQKDIGRTVKSENREIKITNILATYSVYDPIVGYVQGMNCIASILLHHAKQEWAAFWLFVSLIEQLEIRDVFQLQQSSITKYSKMMEFLIYKYLPQIYHNFIEKQILVHLFLSQWLLSLLMQFIPFDQTQQYIDGLLKEGIGYYFKTCLSILKNLQQNIIEEDQIEILILLTSKQYCQLKWHTILNQQWDIPKGSLCIILDSFDQDANQFQRQLIQQKCSNLIDQFFVFINNYIE